MLNFAGLLIALAALLGAGDSADGLNDLGFPRLDRGSIVVPDDVRSCLTRASPEPGWKVTDRSESGAAGAFVTEVSLEWRSAPVRDNATGRATLLFAASSDAGRLIGHGMPHGPGVEFKTVDILHNLVVRTDDGTGAPAATDAVIAAIGRCVTANTAPAVASDPGDLDRLGRFKNCPQEHSGLNGGSYILNIRSRGMSCTKAFALARRSSGPEGHAPADAEFVRWHRCCDSWTSYVAGRDYEVIWGS